MNSNIDEFVKNQKLVLQEEKNRLGLNTQENFSILSTATTNLSSLSDNSANITDSDNLDLNNSQNNKVSIEKDIINLGNCSPNDSSDKSSNYEMSEQWVTDQFFSNFPSLSNQLRRKEELVQKRHEEYQQYLRQIASKSSAEIKRKQELSDNYQKSLQKKKLINEIANGYIDAKVTPTNNTNDDNSHQYHFDLLENLKHTDFSGSKSHQNIVEDRNTHIAEQVNRKKMEYHRDLIKQIEDKKREVEALRARDKAEEERLTKRLEEQLKSMHLEDELRKEKARSEQLRIANEQNHIYRIHLLSKLENDRKLYSNIDHHERKAISENGKDKLAQQSTRPPLSTNSDDHKIYKYFSNSANYPVAAGGRTTPHYANQVVFLDSGGEYDGQVTGDSDVVVVSNSNNSSSEQIDGRPVGSQYCKRCKTHMDPMIQADCLFCERKRNNLPINEEFCLNCGKPLKLMNERESGVCTDCRNTNLMCGFCQKNIEICPNCNAVFCLHCHHQKQQQQHQQQQQLQQQRRSQDLNQYEKSNKQILKENIPTYETNHHLIGKKRTIKMDRPIILHNNNNHNNNNKPKEILFHPNNLPTKKKSYKSFEMIFDESDTEISPPTNNNIMLKPSLFVRTDNKPYSTNVDRNSLFHPTNRIDSSNPDVQIFNGDIFIEDLDAKFANYARNYSILSEKSERKPTIDKSLLREKVHFSDFDSFPLPLMPPPRPPLPSQHFKNKPNGKPESLAVTKLKQKWEVPSIQKNVLTNSNQYSPSKNRVLTQLGAIRKQLQLEQLELDKTLPSTH